MKLDWNIRKGNKMGQKQERKSNDLFLFVDIMVLYAETCIPPKKLENS